MLKNLIRLPKRQEFPLEFQVLLALLRQFIHKQPDPELPKLVSQKPNWSQILTLIHEHRVVGHVSHGVKSKRDIIPLDFQEKLKEARRVQKLKAFDQIKILHQIQRILEDSKIPFVTLKGPVLSQELFDDPTLRMSADLDLIVDPINLFSADKALITQGFVREKPRPSAGRAEVSSYIQAHNNFWYRLNGNGFVIELHWKAYWSHLFDPSLAASSVCQTALGRQNFPTLASAEKWPYLLFHAGKHNWLRLRWLLDFQTTAVKSMTRGPILDAIRNNHANVCLGEMIELSNALFDRNFPASFASSASRLGCQICIKGMALGEYYPKTINGYSHLILMRSRFVTLLQILKVHITPRGIDVETLKLPEPLSFLHYILRPYFILSRFVQRKIDAFKTA